MATTAALPLPPIPTSSTTPSTTTTTPTPPTEPTTTTPSPSTTSPSPTTTSPSPTATTSSSSTANTTTSSTSSTTAPVVGTTAISQTTRSPTAPGVTTVTSTTIVPTSSTSSPTTSGNSVPATGSHNNSFFHNTAAVAGVFSVVGLIGVVILAVLITNTIRRRRAQKFDKELLDATREAAATAPNPIFLDDEEDGEDRYKHSGYPVGGAYNSGNGGGGYSDGSHGTYGQPPMEAYNMRDLTGHSSGVGEIYDPYAAGGAAGIGVARARSMRVDPANASPNIYAAALQEGGSPYPKFAIGPHDAYGGGNGGTPFARGPNNLEAAGMASTGIISRGQQYQQGPPSQEYSNLARNQSSSTGVTQFYPSSTSSTPSNIPSYSQEQHSYPTRQMSPHQASLPSTLAYPTVLTPGRIQTPPHAQQQPFLQPVESGNATRDVDDGEDAYGGYVVESPSDIVPPQVDNAKHLLNPFGTESSSQDRRSDEEEEEGEAPKRVLKVANQ